jgi:hypothetical protein
MFHSCFRVVSEVTLGPAFGRAPFFELAYRAAFRARNWSAFGLLAFVGPAGLISQG